MSDLDFSTLGQEIGEKIEKFINSREMKDLQDNIRYTVESKMEEVRRSAKDAADQVNKNMENYRGNFSRMEGTGKRAYESSVQPGSAVGAGRPQTDGALKPYGKRQLPISRGSKGRAAGILLTILGICGAIPSWTLALIAFVVALASAELEGIAAAGVMAVPAILCTGTVMAGSFLRRRAWRFRSYISAMGSKDFYSIEGLARAVNKKEKYVIKDLRKMIGRGWFMEGHLDEQETCFMLTDESYELYQNAQRELERRKEEAEQLAREQELLESDPVRKQLKMTVEEGNEYIRRIREINDDIPGEEISNKLYRLERVCQEIFDHIGDNPEKLPDIRKFMNYYMPTTLKLVQTYHEFSDQPVQGENIITAKKEIEGMLDNINQAFEKMFDKLFEDDAMDISTDISVMSTMLAQEGLLEDELKIK